jgi:hypothetical protein
MALNECELNLKEQICLIQAVRLLYNTKLKFALDRLKCTSLI